MLAEGELRSNMDESDKVRDLQDKVADLKAEVDFLMIHFIQFSTTLCTNATSNEQNSQLLFCHSHL